MTGGVSVVLDGSVVGGVVVGGVVVVGSVVGGSVVGGVVVGGVVVVGSVVGLPVGEPLGLVPQPPGCEGFGEPPVWSGGVGVGIPPPGTVTPPWPGEDCEPGVGAWRAIVRGADELETAPAW